MKQGIKFLKNTDSLYFSKFKENLNKEMCVTCGEVSLSECDPVYGMCPSCKKNVELTPQQFDELWFSVHTTKS